MTDSELAEIKKEIDRDAASDDYYMGGMTSAGNAQILYDEVLRLRQQVTSQPDIRQLVLDMRRYIIHHGILMGECVAWNRLKVIAGVGQDRNCPSEKDQ